MMMAMLIPGIIGTIGLLAILIIVVVKRRPNEAASNAHEDAFTPPPMLGIQEHLELHPVIASLENALTAEYVQKVKARITASNPALTEAQWNRQWMELKRFFVMASLFKEVPMYHAEEDEIWHEMLMFTDEYHRFCRDFCGQMIHHKPAEAPKPDTDKKAWYEFCYTLLFGEKSGFFQHKIPPAILSEFKTLPHEALIETYFVSSEHPLIQEAVSRIIDEIKRQIHQVETNPEELELSTGISPATAFLVWTLLDNQSYIKSYQMQNHTSSASSCSSFLTPISSGNDSGSGCSSCSGGCGS